MEGSAVLGVVVVVAVLLIAWWVDRRRPPPVPVEFSEPVKQAVFYRAGERCEYCGVRVKMGMKPGWFDTWREFNCDHIVPVVKGGLGVIENGASSCAHCNRVIKVDRDWPEFVREFKRHHWSGPGTPIAKRR